MVKQLHSRVNVGICEYELIRHRHKNVSILNISRMLSYSWETKIGMFALDDNANQLRAGFL